EKATLQTLMKRSIIVPFKKPGDKDVRYSIQKSFYDMFLYRKRPEQQQQAEAAAAAPKTKVQQAAKQQVSAPQPKAWEQKIAPSGSEAYMDILESKGFLVLGN